jgi:hypothetical protein
MKYAVEMSSGDTDCVHTKFHKDWFRHSEVDGGTHIQARTQQGDVVSLFF